MSENDTTTKKSQKTYINGAWILERTFQDGSSILKMSILPEKFIESIKALPKNEDGFVRLKIAKSLTPKPNSTHYIAFDDYKKPVATPAPKPAIKKVSEKVTVPSQEVSEDVRDFV